MNAKPLLPNDERPIEKVIGENISKYFAESNLKITNFAFLIGNGSDTTRTRNLMEGKSHIRSDKLQRIAAILGVKTIDLIEDWSEQNKKECGASENN